MQLKNLLLVTFAAVFAVAPISLAVQTGNLRDRIRAPKEAKVQKVEERATDTLSREQIKLKNTQKFEEHLKTLKTTVSPEAAKERLGAELEASKKLKRGGKGSGASVSGREFRKLMSKSVDVQKVRDQMLKKVQQGKISPTAAAHVVHMKETASTLKKKELRKVQRDAKNVVRKFQGKPIRK